MCVCVCVCGGGGGGGVPGCVTACKAQCPGWIKETLKHTCNMLGGVRNYRKLKSFHNTYGSGWVGGSWSITELLNTEMINRAHLVAITKNNVISLVIV